MNVFFSVARLRSCAAVIVPQARRPADPRGGDSARCAACRRGRQLSAQHGQAAAEALLVLVVLMSLWVATAWLLRYQDIALQAQHAGRYAAFALTRDPGALAVADIRHGYFPGPAHRWADRRGASLLSLDRSEVDVQIDRASMLDASGQPGGTHADAIRLRQGWRIEDEGIITARVKLAATLPDPAPGRRPSGLAQFDAWRPGIVRHTAVLAGAGHASTDAQAQQRVAGSDLGWAASASRSQALARQVQDRAAALDQPWGRPALDLDWLGPWAARIPGHHLQQHSEAIHGYD